MSYLRKVNKWGVLVLGAAAVVACTEGTSLLGGDLTDSATTGHAAGSDQGRQSA